MTVSYLVRSKVSGDNVRFVNGRAGHVLGLLDMLHRRIRDLADAPKDVETYAELRQLSRDLASLHGVQEDDIEAQVKVLAEAEGTYAIGKVKVLGED